MTSPRSALLVALACLAACAPTQAAAPPEPELIEARPTSTVPTATAPTSEPASGSPVPGSTAPRSTASTTPPLVGWAAFDAVIERETVGSGAVGASVAVVVDGELTHTAAFGRRDLAADEAAETVDRFRVASISKLITAVVVLQLVEAGVVGIDEPIGERLAAHLGVVPTDPDVASLTPELLMSHRSGVPEYDGVFFGGGTTPCEDGARSALAGPVGTPGGFRYSNMNVCLLGVLVEALTGRPYAEVTYERLLTPLGIAGMRLAGTYDAGPDEAVHFSAPGRGYMEALGAAGAWIASATDVARIVASLDPDAAGWRPLGDELLSRMRRQPGPDLDGPAGYGLGAMLLPDGSFGHTGTLESTHAMVVQRPDGVTWAVLVNGEVPSESSRLASIVDTALRAGFPDG